MKGIEEDNTNHADSICDVEAKSNSTTVLWTKRTKKEAQRDMTMFKMEFVEGK